MSKALNDNSFVIDGVVVIHRGLSSVHTIDLSQKTCNCRWFMAYSMCAHLYKASDLYKFKLSHDRPSRFVTRPRPGKKTTPKTFHQNFTHQVEVLTPITEAEQVVELVSDQIESNYIELQPVDVNLCVPMPESCDQDVNVEGTEIPTTKRSRGRPAKKRKAIDALENEGPVKRGRGRPPKAKPALEFN